MASDRPLFDDEDLPAWLKNAGITYGGQQDQPASSAARPQSTDEPLAARGSSSGSAAFTAPVGGDEELPWLQDVAPAEAAATPSSASPFGDINQEDLDWLHSEPSAPAAPTSAPGSEVTGSLPWQQDVSNPEDQTAQQPEPTGLMPWEASPMASNTPNTPPEKPQPVKRLTPRPEETPPLSSQPSAPTDSTGGDLSWLDEALAAQSNATPTPSAPQPAPPAQPVQPPPSPQRPVQPVQAAPTPPQAPEPPAIKPIKRLPTSEPAAPEQPPAGPPRPIKRLPSREPDLSNMTYEEWERLQNAKEQEAQSDPADKVLDEVPDWFKGPGASPAPADSAPAGPEFMPDWYMGMEEQKPDAAPDWFKNVDLSGTQLVGPETVQSSPAGTAPGSGAATPPAASADDEVPDWFKGVGVEGLDFNAMFGSQPTPEPAAPATSPAPPAPAPQPVQQAPEIPSEPPQPTPEPVAAQPPTSQAEEALGWMTELPDLEELVGQPEPAVVSTETPPEPAAQAPELAPAAADSEALDWTAESPAAAETPVPPTEPAADVLPEWMQDLKPSEPEPAAQAPAAEPAADEMPEWMRDLTPTEPEPAAPATPQPGAEPELDWLAQMDTLPAAEPPSSPAPSAQPPQPEIDWLAEEPAASPFGGIDGGSLDIDQLLSLGPDEPVPSAGPMVPVEPEAQTLEAEEFSLDDLLGPAPQKTKAEPETIDLDALNAALPAQPIPPVEEAGPPRVGRLVPVPPAPQPTQETPKPREELPEWISELQPSEAAVALRIGDQEVRLPEKPQVRLTDQLRQLRDRARALTGGQAGVPAPEAGPLAGIPGALEAIPLVTEPGKVETAVAPAPGDAQIRRVQLIQKILAVEEELLHERALSEEELAAKQAARRAKPSRVKLDRIVITVVLALALITPFFVNTLNTVPPLAGAPLTPALAGVASAIDSIQPSQNVLVAFEYGPSAAGELDDLARIMLRDIIRRQARPVIVSTNPSGAMHAQSLMASMSVAVDDLVLMGRTGKSLVPGQDFIVLHYLPGGVMGVRSIANALLGRGLQQQIVFGTDLQGRASGLTEANLVSLRSNPAFVLTENPEDVRNWVEQYQVPLTDKPQPIVLLSSAGASAVADTYARSAPDKHILGPLVGLRDGLIYQGNRQPFPSAQKIGDQRWQSIALSTLLASVVILLGTAINLIRSLQRRERR